MLYGHPSVLMYKRNDVCYCYNCLMDGLFLILYQPNRSDRSDYSAHYPDRKRV